MLSLEDMAALTAAEEKRLGVNSPEFSKIRVCRYCNTPAAPCKERILWNQLKSMWRISRNVTK